MNIEIEIPVNARVECADGPCGTSTHVVLNPRTRRITHVVVKEKDFPHADHLVPVTLVEESMPHFIRLRATRKDVATIDPFTEVAFDRFDDYSVRYPPGSVWSWPYEDPFEPEPPFVERELTPGGEVAVSRGTHVEARDGRVGRVDDLVVDPATDRVTHLVLREGHLWGQRDVTIPVEAIERVDDGAVHLLLDKRR